eukprot:gene5663-5900_t
MGSLKSQQRIPMRTSYGGRSSLSGRKDKRSEASSYSISLPLILLVISVVAVVGILKLEHLSQHISISIPRRSSLHTPTSVDTAQKSARVGVMPPTRLANTAAEPEAPIPSAIIHATDDDSVHPPAFESLSLGLPNEHNPSFSEPSSAEASPEAPAFQPLSLGSARRQHQPHHLAQEQQTTPDTAATLQHIAASTSASHSAIASPPVSRTRLLLATHSRLMWYYPDSDEYRILHEGEGVHYGMFTGAGSPSSTVWTAVRPHNWRPTTTKEYLLELDMETGAELRRVQLPSRFTHDVVRHGSSVYVCDTGNGRILQLSFPAMKPSDIVRVNVSAMPTIPDPDAWLQEQYNKLEDEGLAGSSQPPTARPNQPEGAGYPILGRVQRVGQKAHGLVPWQGAYIMLDSDNGALMALDLTGNAQGDGFRLVQLWKTPEKGTFLKGLAVVDDVAYFGISPWAPRSARDDPKTNNELAAFDLIAGQLLWRREVPTAGLLNTVGAPHLEEGSTYLPSYTGVLALIKSFKPHNWIVSTFFKFTLGTSVLKDTTALGQGKLVSAPICFSLWAGLTDLGYPPVVGGYWSSGLPYLDTSIKGTKRPWEAGLQLPLINLNISSLQAAVAALPEEAWTYEYQAKHSAVMAGREGNQAAFKPGVEGIVLLFSANDGSGPVFKFPFYDYFAAALDPLLEEVVGKKDMQHIIRLQLALMKPGVSDIKIHVDSGGYAIKGHRIHIPVFTHPEVHFDVCPHRYVPDPDHIPENGEPQRILDIQECFKIPTVEGFVFELNNRAAHKVSNYSPVPRVHVVVDLCEEPHPRVEVPPGTVCDYDMEKGLLCKHPQAANPEVLPPARWLDAAAAALEQGIQAPATAQPASEEAAGQGLGLAGCGGSAQGLAILNGSDLSPLLRLPLLLLESALLLPGGADSVGGGLELSSFDALDVSGCCSLQHPDAASPVFKEFQAALGRLRCLTGESCVINVMVTA